MSSVNATGGKSPLLMSEALVSASSATTSQATTSVTQQTVTETDTVTISDEARQLLESTSGEQTDDTGVEPPIVTTFDTGIEPPKATTFDTGIEPPKQK